MNMDYRYERGLVGNWKELSVYILEKNDYVQNQYHLKDDVIYVIADDGMRMVHKGYVIGYLSKAGSVTECDKVRYRPVVPVAAKEVTSTSTSGEEIILEVEVNVDYRKYASVVEEFFSHLQDPIIVEA